MKLTKNKNYLMLTLYKRFKAPWRHPHNWLFNIKYWFRSFKYAYQRAKYGFCESDLWDLDAYLCELIPTMLRNFTKDLHGAPHEYFDPENNSDQLWIDKVHEVAAAWEKMSDMYDNAFDYTSEEHMAARDKAFYELKEIFYNLWD